MKLSWEQAIIWPHLLHLLHFFQRRVKDRKNSNSLSQNTFYVSKFLPFSNQQRTLYSIFLSFTNIHCELRNMTTPTKVIFAIVIHIVKLSCYTLLYGAAGSLAVKNIGQVTERSLVGIPEPARWKISCSALEHGR